MADAAQRCATYEDLLGVPDHLVAELIMGALHVQPRPSLPHTMAASALGEELGPPFKRGRGGPGGWIIMDEPELHLGADVLVPDLAGWRRERMPTVPNSAHVALPPDWVCEVLSPRTRVLDRTAKLPIYARENVGHTWLVDPIDRTVEVLERQGAQWMILGTYHGDIKVRARPFDAIELDLSILWADVDRPEPEP